MRTKMMTVGRGLAGGGLELVGLESPGLEPERIYTTAATVIAVSGSDEHRRVLVDVSEDESATAQFVRDLLPPHRIDIGRLEDAQAAFRRAGIDDLLSEPTAQVVGAWFAQLLDLSLPQPPLDPREYLTRVFLHRASDRDEVFPTMWWDDDPSVGIDELAGLLERQGMTVKLPRKRLLAEAVRDVSRLHCEVARNELCTRLCAVANQLLAGSTDCRLCGPYVSTFDNRDPEWLFTTPSQYDALISEGLLVAWDPARWAPMEVSVRRRPPDLGEIDFSNFPTGDDPF